MLHVLRLAFQSSQDHIFPVLMEKKNNPHKNLTPRVESLKAPPWSQQPKTVSLTTEDSKRCRNGCTDGGRIGASLQPLRAQVMTAARSAAVEGEKKTVRPAGGWVDAPEGRGAPTRGRIPSERAARTAPDGATRDESWEAAEIWAASSPSTLPHSKCVRVCDGVGSSLADLIWRA